MAIEVTTIAELDPDEVAQSTEEVRTLLLEMNPRLDTRRGPMHDLVLSPSALLVTARRTEMDRLRQSSSLKLINENPVLAVDEIVDATMSNYRLERKTGLQASGNVTIIVAELTTISIPAGGIFEADGQQFEATAAFIGRPSQEAVQDESDRLLRPLGDGTYAFGISVQAVEAGDAGMLTKESLLVPTFSILSFIKAFASQDFVGGRDQETNASLAFRALAGVAAQTASNRVTMTAAILGQDAFQDIVNMSIIGYGDAEEIRDQHSLFPMSFGGRVDWYVRSTQLPTRVTETMEATLVEDAGGDRGIWQISIPRDMHAGYYDILTIVPEGTINFGGTFPIVFEQRGFDLTELPGELIPDIITAEEAAFSRFQTCTIKFKDTETSTEGMAVGSEKKFYDVTFRGMILIPELQTYIADRAFRYRGGDMLIKAAVPCFVSLAFVIEGPADHVLPDRNVMAESLATYINTLGFSGRLYASSLYDIIESQMSPALNVSTIDIVGQVLRPDGVIRTIRSSQYIEIPYEPDRMVSGRTAVFICDPADIAISAATVSVPQVL